MRIKITFKSFFRKIILFHTLHNIINENNDRHETIQTECNEIGI